jgi:hypothetical protein
VYQFTALIALGKSSWREKAKNRYVASYSGLDTRKNMQMRSSYQRTSDHVTSTRPKKKNNNNTITTTTTTTNNTDDENNTLGRIVRGCLAQEPVEEIEIDSHDVTTSYALLQSIWRMRSEVFT